MKRVAILLLVLLAQPGWSQPGRPPKRVILFENHKEYFIFRVGETQNLTFFLPGEKRVSGTVWEIRCDTIVIGDTTVLAGDIVEIRKNYSSAPASKSPAGSRFRPPTRQPSVRSVGFYRADTSVWKIVCPPGDSYRSSWSFHTYLSKRERILKSEKNARYNPLIYKNFLKFNVIKLAHLEVAFSYERVLAPKVSLETELGVLFGIQNANAYYTVNYPVYNYNGFTATVCQKFYAISPRSYVGMVFMYRYLWFTQIRTGWPGGGENGDLQDQYRNDLGGSLRIGMMRRYGEFVVDWYVGAGVKYILLHQLVYADFLYHDSSAKHWRHPDHSPDVYNKVLIEPVINGGIKIGFGF